MLGGFILFLGFLSFNAGSQFSAFPENNNGSMVAKIFVNTVICGSGGIISVILIELGQSLFYRREPCWSFLVGINGGLTGMVASAAGCNVISPLL